MGAVGEYIKSAIASIRNNRGRSVLTMLGIIIGIMSVLTVLILGDGLEADMQKELNKGASSVTVKLETTKTDRTFTREAYRKLEETFAGRIYGLDVSMEMQAEVANYRGAVFSVFLSGTGDAARQAKDMEMVKGRYFTAEDVHDTAPVCVIPDCAAKPLFGYEDVVGRTLTLSVNEKSFDLTVVGLRKSETADMSLINYDNLYMYVPYTTYCEVLGLNPDTSVTSVNLVMDSDHKKEVSAKAVSVVENILEIRGEKAVKLVDGAGFGALENILKIVEYVVMLIAAISLIVGGIGVMNIMTVSVTERTREIGIRKSLGARTSSIMIQFLAEAAILTVIGGIIGVLNGFGIAYLICRIVNIAFVINPSSVILVVGISVFIGIFFGIYPARRAARLNPIEALRAE